MVHGGYRSILVFTFLQLNMLGYLKGLVFCVFCP